eukprot:TRINITY_DN80231_c0_g1_i1.p1 TRINITY_DN80231_c0_g1~~TRINITY_DN80231_c0_g1_i1.p1  ORF type:complete len:378 (+),score=107.22 TRINITY_DN80231_c0_g1_i1:28-1161(+)
MRAALPVPMLALRAWALLLAALLVACVQGKATGGGSKKCSHTGYYGKKIVPLCESHYPEISSKHTWVVQFYHPGVQKVFDQREAFEQLAAEPEKIDGVKVGAVDCQQNGKFCSKQGITEVPTTRVMQSGNAREYTGEHTLEALRTYIAESMVRFKQMAEALNCDVKGLFSDAKKDATIPLCASSFPPALEPLPWIVSFYESGDRNKDKTMRGTMNRLAEKYGNSPPKKVDNKKTPKIRFGAIDCSEEKNDCSKFGVTTYPSVRWYQSGVDPVDFDSFFDSDELKQFASARLKAMPKPEEAKAIEADMEGAAGEASAPGESKQKSGKASLEALNKELEALKQMKGEAVKNEEFQEAKRISNEIKQVEAKIKKIEKTEL